MRMIVMTGLFLLSQTSGAQGKAMSCKERLDSLLSAETTKPFNGIVMVGSHGKACYAHAQGVSDLSSRTALEINDRFVIGSISKQVTAVLVLREMEKGRLNLDDPLRIHLPGLKQPWADSVTIHHLLTYTHGITGTGKPLAFKPGSQFSYSQLGYELLAQVAEKTSGKTFAELSTELFRNCGMNHTSHPDVNKSQLVKAYTGDPGEQPVLETNSFENHVAAGGFISTAGDLLLWNECLFGGKLLKPATLKLMTSAQPNAVRQHPIFGATNYGYGITVTNDHGLLQLGQTGFAPGFMSMDFYFPGTGTSVVVLQNILYDGSDVKKISCFHTAILKIIKESLLKKETQ